MASYRRKSTVGAIVTAILILAILGTGIWAVTYFAKSCNKDDAKNEWKVSFSDNAYYARNNINDDKLAMTVTEKAYNTGTVMSFTPVAIDKCVVDTIKCNAADATIDVSDTNVVTVTVIGAIDQAKFSVMVVYKSIT